MKEHVPATSSQPGGEQERRSGAAATRSRDAGSNPAPVASSTVQTTTSESAQQGYQPQALGGPPPSEGSRSLSPEDPRFEKAVQYDGVRRFQRNPLVNAADLEDLAQECRIAVWRQAPNSRSLAARYAAIDWHRREFWRKRDGRYVQRGPRWHEQLARYPVQNHSGKGGLAIGGIQEDSDHIWRRRFSVFDRALDDAEAEDASPELAVLRVAIDRVLAGMERRNALILRLRYLHSYLQAEIGEELGISESRVCQLLPKAEAEFLSIWRRLEFKQAA